MLAHYLIFGILWFKIYAKINTKKNLKKLNIVFVRKIKNINGIFKNTNVVQKSKLWYLLDLFAIMFMNI